MKKIILLNLMLLACGFAFAQEEENLEVVVHYTDAGESNPIEVKKPDQSIKQNKLSIGAHLGLSQSGTDTHSWGRHGEGLLSHAHVAYGINAKYAFSPNFAIRGDYFGSKLSGNDQDNTGPCTNPDDFGVDISCHRDRGWSFSSPLHEFSASMELDLLGHKRYPKRKYFDADGNRVNSNFINTKRKTYYNEDGEIIQPQEIHTFQRRLSPYFAIGVAMTYVDPDKSFDPNGNGFPDASLVALDDAEQENWYMHIPITVGLRYDLSEKLFIDGELRGVVPTTDLLDGMKYIANTQELFDDNYQFATLRIGYRIGKKSDRDGDGVLDSRDNCPDVYGSPMLKGCPDSDNDGIADEMDACPNTKGIKKFAGCPDTDNDGVQDLLDACPNEAGSIETKGCPDTDKDGVVDADDQCPNKFGKADLDGCPDRDNDGIADHRDACPDTPGDEAFHGCKEGYPSLKEKVDEEKQSQSNSVQHSNSDETKRVQKKRVQNTTEKIVEEKERVRVVEEKKETIIKTEPKEELEVIVEDKVVNRDPPQTATETEQRTKTLNEQTNTKRDAVVELATKEAGRTVYNLLTYDEEKEVERVFDQALEGIRFNSSRWTFKPESYTPMDKVVRVMKEYPKLRVAINGHTDSTGDAEDNLVLSQNRANAVREYLISNDIAPYRLTAMGFGEEQPIADNNTSQGRYQNRRVEFKIIK